MTPSFWNAAAVVLAGIMSVIVARVTAKAQNRKTDAEARMLDAQTQEIITKGWNADLARRDIKITKLETLNTKQEKQILGFDRRLEAIDSDLQDAHEQNDLLSAELAEERKKTRLLESALEIARDQLAAALAELENAKDQIKVLIEHAKRVDDWWQWHFSTNGHTDETDRPPSLTPFTEEN
jgi:chromosome segregation ATPase